jgi:glucoamylase
MQEAFGAPGTPPTWTSSAKDMVGCALGPSRLWFTTGYGILNEVYSPRVDIPQIRDLGFIVADDKGFWVEVKRLDNYTTSVPAAGIPAVEIVHTHERFELRLRIVPDPQREALLMEVTLSGDESLRPYAMLAPHLGGSGHDNAAESAQYRGRAVLWAEKGPFGLALAAADAQQCDAFAMTSAGIVGASDAWSDFDQHGKLTWQFESAGPGNVSLVGQLPRQSTLALGLATSREAAATLALSSLTQPFDAVWDAHVSAWREWHRNTQWPVDVPDGLADALATSTMVLRVHQDKTFPGAMVASLSVPWGNAHDDVGGYHLVWPRDVVESAGALLAVGALPEARNVLRYLIATQLAAGNWSQNQWLGGKPFWQGNQLDEAAFPVLLAAALAERNALGGIEVADMVRRALTYVANHGPATEQDRWEEDSGINAFTLATCIAALVAGAPWLPVGSARDWALAIADHWNAHIEDWTAAYDTDLSRAHGVPGYYVRIAAPPDGKEATSNRLKRVLAIKNLQTDPGLATQDQVATDFLQLVRMGLRDAHDPLITGTVRIVDAMLKVDTPHGPAWHRYNGDGYGEHDDGSPFDGTGRGRAWPLLTGERGHYELVAGHDPLSHLQSMAAMVGRCGLMPEQVWDHAETPTGTRLELGLPSGSAMPLVWAHAEFVKLLASRALGRPFDRPNAVWARYGGRKPEPMLAIWTPSTPLLRIRAGQTLVLCLPDASCVHWGVDGWQPVTDTATTFVDGLGLQVASLDTSRLANKSTVQFTWRVLDGAQWVGVDYAVNVG